MDAIVISATNKGIKFETNNQMKLIQNGKTAKMLFDRLAKEKITRYHNNKKKNFTSIMFGDTICRINNYNEIKKLKLFNSLNKEINNFKLQKVFEKLKSKKVIVIGSIVGIATISSIVNLPNNTETTNLESLMIEQASITGHLELDDDVYEEELSKLTDKVYDDDIDPLTNISLEEYDENVIEDDNLDIVTNVIDENDDLEPTTNNIDENDNTLESISYDTTSIKQTSNSSNIVDFSEMKNFSSYSEYIELAAKLYGVDSDTAFKLIQENYQKFTAPGKKVNAVYADELDRMKDLISRGLIEGDIKTIGIFLTIKDYALEHLNLGGQTPIKSSKTPAEREKDVVLIAKYIYGVTNPEMLNTMVAVCRTESGSGTSPVGQNKNNIGGNMGAGGKLNSYKTAEYGAEGMVRAFLTIYDKSLINNDYDTSIPIPRLMSKMYCFETYKEWEDVVSGIIVDQNIAEKVDNYLYSDTKIL